MRGQPGRLSAFVVVCALSASSLGAAPASATPAEQPATIDWHRCGGGFQCGKLPVPVDDAVDRRAHDRPRGHPASGSVNPGRASARSCSIPAVPASPDFPFCAAWWTCCRTELRDRFDLVALDPRGVGSSSPIRCAGGVDPLFDQTFSPTPSEQRSALVDAFRSLAAACEQHDGAILAHVSTREGAHDLDVLRAALGEGRLSYLGFSYGTYLGTLYAAAYPQRVRAMVLDGAVDPTLDAEATALVQARGFEHALDDFLGDCARHAGCTFHHGGDSAAAYERLRARAGRDPIPVRGEPGRSAQSDPIRRRGAAGAVFRTGRLADARPSTGGRGARGRLRLARHGRHLRRAPERRHRRPQPRGLLGGQLPRRAGRRSPDAAARIEARAAQVAPRLGAFVANLSLACSVWPIPPLATVFDALPARGAPPILVVGTTDDPATPLSQARSLAHELDRSVLLVAQGEQHTAFVEGNQCVDRAVTRYLVRREPPKVGTRC